MVNSKDRLFLRTVKGHTYLIHRTYVGNKRRDQSIPLDAVEREILQAALLIKGKLEDQKIDVPCFNPNCKNTIPMTKKQLAEFFISSKKRYNMTIFPCCSPDCRNEMLAQHGGRIDGSNES